MYQKQKPIRRAMVVDDNEVNTLVLASMLELFGFQAEQIYSGSEALNSASKTIYDIIFVDHIMPEMDGLQTTKMLRNRMGDNNSVIIALTSSVTGEMKRLYQTAGANDVYEKPLGLTELTNIINRWYPEAVLKSIPRIEDISTNDDTERDLMKEVLEDVGEINYYEGLKHAVGNREHYAHILYVSLKDISNGIQRIKQCISIGSYIDLMLPFHSLKSVFSNIGAIGLSEEVSFMEDIINRGDTETINRQTTYFIHHLNEFREKLSGALDYYGTLISSKETKHKMDCPSMTKEEYEQSISKTIYYIKRFEYDSIVKSLNRLIQSGDQKYRYEFMLALDDVEDFNYEKALQRLKSIKEMR